MATSAEQLLQRAASNSLSVKPRHVYFVNNEDGARYADACSAILQELLLRALNILNRMIYAQQSGHVDSPIDGRMHLLTFGPPLQRGLRAQSDVARVKYGFPVEALLHGWGDNVDYMRRLGMQPTLEQFIQKLNDSIAHASMSAQLREEKNGRIVRLFVVYSQAPLPPRIEHHPGVVADLGGYAPVYHLHNVRQPPRPAWPYPPPLTERDFVSRSRSRGYAQQRHRPLAQESSRLRPISPASRDVRRWHGSPNSSGRQRELEPCTSSARDNARSAGDDDLRELLRPPEPDDTFNRDSDTSDV